MLLIAIAAIVARELSSFRPKSFISVGLNGGKNIRHIGSLMIINDRPQVSSYENHQSKDGGRGSFAWSMDEADPMCHR
jgi:hypothetical protein